MPKDLADPVAKCPKKATIAVQVDTYDREKKKDIGVAGVTAKIVDGPTKPGPKKTSGKGYAEFPNLDPGSYTVSITVEGGMAKYYDLDPAPDPQSQTLAKGDDEILYWKLDSFWIGAKVLYPNGKLAKDYAYKLNVKALKGGQLDDKWSLHKDDKSTEKGYEENYVQNGRYQLLIPEVSPVDWPSDPLILDEAVDLQATVSGVDIDSAGTFDIYDPHDLSTSLETIQAKVADDGALGKELKASWTPSKAKLTNLKCANLVFSATAGTASAFSPLAQLVAKQDFTVEDPKGKKLAGHLTLVCSGGGTIDEDVVDGKATVKVPWSETIVRVTFTGLEPCTVTFEEDNAAARGLFLPV